MAEVNIKMGFATLLLVFLLAVGTVVFHNIETYPDHYRVEELRGQPWGYIDSFYFSAMTLTTIGYGDLYPTNDLSKIFTVVYAVMGVAIVLYALGVFAKWYITRSQRFEEHEIAKLRALLHRHGNQKKDNQ